MIVRKPYAFLIKYFKVIHIGLFVLMTYMLFRIRTIYMFFRDYLKSGTYTYVTDMVSKYVNLPMLFFTIILIGTLLLIFFLMRQKKKPVFFYLTANIFYIITFVTFILLIGFFNKLEFQTYSNQTLVLYRDLTMALYYLNYIFLAVSFIRGFGFNIKKFNFEKDIKELDITEADREEIEIGVSVDVDKVANYLRKGKRNFGYYFKENSFVLIIFGVVVGLGLVSYIALSKLVVNKTYREGNSILASNVEYKVNASYLTNKNKVGKVIKNANTYYLIVDFSVTNKRDKDFQMELDNTRIKVKDKYYYPLGNMVILFGDFGNFYRKQKLKKDVQYNFVVAFEVDNPKVVNENVILEIYNYKKASGGEATLYYKDVSLNPYIFRDKKIGNYKLNEEINLKNTYLKNGTFSVLSYQVLDMLDYTYTKCNNSINDGECFDYNASVVPSASKKLLKIKYKTDIDTDIFTYLNLEYTVNDKSLTISSTDIKNLTPSNYIEDDVVLLEVPNEIKEGMTLKFVFDLWGDVFTYA